MVRSSVKSSTLSSSSSPMIDTQPQQARLTDFFSTVRSSGGSKNGHNGKSVITGKRIENGGKLLPLSTDLLSSTTTATNLSLTRSNDKNCSTPSKRKHSGDDLMISTTSTTTSGSATKRCKTPAKSVKSKCKTTKSTTTATKSRSKRMIQFGPSINKLDFEINNATTTTTTTRTTRQSSKATSMRLAVGEDGMIELVSSSSSSSASSSSTLKSSIITNTSVASSDNDNQTTTATVNVSKKLEANQIKERLKDCNTLSKLKQHLSRINDCADKVKQFKQMKVPLLSPVKSSYTSPKKNCRTPEKYSVTGLSVIPSPLRLDSGGGGSGKSPRTPTKKHSKLALVSPFLVNAVPKDNCGGNTETDLGCRKKLFADDDNDDENNNRENNRNVKPAYQRFAHLINSKPTLDKQTTTSTATTTSNVETELTLPLPYHFSRLITLFRNIDYFVWNFYRRGEACTFDKLSLSIVSYTKSKSNHFDHQTLAKVLTIVVDHMKKRWFRLAYEAIGNEQKLVLNPIYDGDEEDSSVVGGGQHCLSSATRLLYRKKQFTAQLLELTKQAHLRFLSNMNLTLSPTKPVYNWHPMFALDTMVPDIVPNMSLIPVKPVSSLSSSNGGIQFNNNKSKNSIVNYIIHREPFQSKTVLTNGEKDDACKPEPVDDDKNDLMAKMKKASENLSTQQATPAQIKSGPLKGISMDILNKVRANMAAKQAALMYRSPAVDRELLMLNDMRDVIRTIYASFHAELRGRKIVKSLPYESVVNNVALSGASSGAWLLNDARKRVDYLLDLALQSTLDDNHNDNIVEDDDGDDERKKSIWLNKITIANQAYIQMDPTCRLADLFRQIDQRMRKLKQSCGGGADKSSTTKTTMMTKTS